jgi:hypothetical protein
MERPVTSSPELTIRAALRPTLEQAVEAWAVLASDFPEQVQRLCEVWDVAGEGFWRGRSAIFRPGASVSEELPYVLSLARPDEEWMDIGVGAGRLAIPLSRAVRRVIGVDTSEAMRSALASGIAEAGRDNIDVRDTSWPDGGDFPTVDVTLAANMLYSDRAPLGFIEAMEAHTRRLCVIALADRAPRMPDPTVWEGLYGEPLAVTPGARELVTLLGAAGRSVNVMTFPAAPPRAIDLDQAVLESRGRYGLGENSPRLPRLRELFVEHFGQPDGTVHVRAGRTYTAVITWEP